MTIVRHCCKHFAVRLWTNTVEVCILCKVFHKSYYSTAIETTLIPFVLTRIQYITRWRICCLARNSPFENDRTHCLPFKGEVASDGVNRRLFRAIRSTFASATLKSWFTTSTLFSLNLKDKIPSQDQSMVVYSFSCCCAAEYIGRTTRRFSQRIREHHPAWLRTGENKFITSSVVAHLGNTNHIVEPTRSFRVIYQAPLNQPKFTRQRILAAAESIAIRQRQPVLCLQKQFAQSLCLPWPQVTNVDLTQTQNTNHYSVT